MADITLNPDLDILETTLRDGSYVVDFRFTAADTAWMSARLAACGIKWIEIGHGMGLRAYERHGAAEVDEAYIDAARAAAPEAKIGMFCIPGVAKLDDLDLAASHGLDFVRIGTNVDETDQMEAFIDRASEKCLYVCTNFMKSYSMPPPELVRAS